MEVPRALLFARKMDIDKLRQELKETYLKHKQLKDQVQELEAKMRILDSMLSSFSDYSGALKRGSFLAPTSLEHFLESNEVVFGPNLYCRQKVFVSAFNEHCKLYRFLCPVWSSRLYSRHFEKYGITVANNTIKRYPNVEGAKTYNEVFIIGVDINNFESKEETED